MPSVRASLSRVRSHSVTTLSSEESELLRIRVERSALAKLAQQNARHLDAVLHGSDSVDSMLPVRSTKPLTQPQDIKLHTSGRPKVRAPVEEPVAEKKKPTALAPGQLTQAKPFSFMTDARSRSASVAPSPVASRAASRAASRSTSRAASRSVSRSVSRSASRSGSKVGSRVGSRAGSPSRSAAAAAASAAPTPSQPREFSFATSLRAAFKTAGLGDAAAETPASARKSRTAGAGAGAGAGGLTQPKPFVLSTDSRLGAAPAAAAGSTPFVSLAAQAASFLGKGNDRVVAAPAPTAAQALTTPREFKFHTTARERSVSSSAVSGAAAAKEEKQPEKPAAASGTHRSLDSFRAPQLTQVQPFHLTLPAERARREDKDALELAAVEKERAERKARLLAAAKPAGSTTTIAQAPALAVLQRVPLKEPVAPVAEPAKPTEDAASTPRLTAPHPFHLSTDARGANKSDAFQSRVEEETTKARMATEFHARPMPVTEAAAVFVPKVPQRKILADLPPALRSVALHAASQAQFASQIAAEQNQAAAARTFVAKPLPATILGSVSFVPKPSDKALTTPAELSLSSSSRAAKRAAYEHEQAQRAEAAEKRRQALRAQEEAQKIKAFRQTLVHQAKPVPATSAGTKAPR